ncbi:MAG: hypothetical protein CL823_01630 [Crocinitomicaceae bacterium]|nr:hypothetical protein [Crocinitomicaceae bacterium]|tara:strand:- start:1795 stop:2100 length:306 start_codon:yes stop_codon:yes gene_type:complete
MQRLKTITSFILEFLKNRYAATSVIALLWVMFISDIDIFFIASEKIELNKMKDKVTEITEKNVALKHQLKELNKNPRVLERVARERYFMKKPLEEVYRIVD